MVSLNSSLPGTLAARLNWPPTSWSFSNSVTRCPRAASAVAQAMPATPAPTTATAFGEGEGAKSRAASVSCPARGFTRHETGIILKVWSRHAWLQAMQVFVASSWPRKALATRSGSAKKGRAIETRSDASFRKSSSQTLTSLMRFVAQRATSKSGPSRRLSSAVVKAKAARGTHVAIVGTRASCQPTPVLSTSTPSSRNDPARAMASSKEKPPFTSSKRDSLKTTAKLSNPTALRMSRTMRTAKRLRFSKEDPPHRSVRSPFVSGARNSLIK
mmetsp:Transcript_2900/g.8763  ORF Transcript_2900/g.8763 Transcript_2900/m.8763 type:complete len:272 (-) Transcript_2900:634-1449(-)